MRGSSLASAGIAGVILLGGGLVAGCKPRQAAFAPPPPPDVQVAHPIVKMLPQTLDFTGFTRGIDQVQVRAQVRGYLISRSVKGGERVKKGDVLFMIDPRPFQAAVAQAKADLSQNDAKLRLAQIKLERTQGSGSSVSKTEMDQAVADRDAAQAALEFSKAKLDSAQIDLGWTNVVAPINGRISVDVPSIGSMVGDNMNQTLVEIIDDSTMYATFNVPELTVQLMRKQYNYSRPGEGGRPPLPIYIGFESDNGRFPFAGQYESSDPGFDPNTGTTVVRAIFQNPEGAIAPGAFARIRGVVGEQQYTLVPDAAVSTDQVGRYIMTVDDKGIVQRTAVTTGDVVDRMRKITSDLPTSSLVIINGLQRARPGIPVKTTLVDLPEPHVELGVEPTSQPSTQPATPALMPPTTEMSTTQQTPTTKPE